MPFVSCRGRFSQTVRRLNALTPQRQTGSTPCLTALANAPGTQEFSAADDPHLKCGTAGFGGAAGFKLRSLRLFKLFGSLDLSGRLGSSFLSLRHFRLWRWRRRSGTALPDGRTIASDTGAILPSRLRKALPRDIKRFVKVSILSHFCARRFSVHRLPRVGRPRYRICSSASDRTPARRTGNGPLLHHPVDVAVQGHFAGLHHFSWSITFQPAHIGLQHVGHCDRAALLLVGFHDSDQRAADGGCRSRSAYARSAACRPARESAHPCAAPGNRRTPSSSRSRDSTALAFPGSHTSMS